MSGSETAASLTDETRLRAAEVLAEYLIGSPWAAWPGVDAMTVEQVVRAAYPRAVATGQVPPPEELARRHADLAAAILMIVAAGPTRE
jgi:hypothetical protein